MRTVIEFPRPPLRHSQSFRDFLRWRYGLMYPGLFNEWLNHADPNGEIHHEDHLMQCLSS